MKPKIILLFVLFFVVIHFAPCEESALEFVFRTIKDAPAWNTGPGYSRFFGNLNAASTTIKKGETVIVEAVFHPFFNEHGIEVVFFRVRHEGREYAMNEEDLIHVDMSDFRPTHITATRLRLRDNPTTTSSIITTLDVGIEVQAWETGHMATIDGITAPWVRILNSDGFTGWAFSGYLEAVYVPVPVAETPVIEVPEEIPVAASPTEQPVHVLFEQEQGSNNNTVLFIILGAGGLLLAVVVLIILKWKKRGG